MRRMLVLCSCSVALGAAVAAPADAALTRYAGFTPGPSQAITLLRAADGRFVRAYVQWKVACRSAGPTLRATDIVLRSSARSFTGRRTFALHHPGGVAERATVRIGGHLVRSPRLKRPVVVGVVRAALRLRWPGLPAVGCQSTASWNAVRDPLVSARLRIRSDPHDLVGFGRTYDVGFPHLDASGFGTRRHIEITVLGSLHGQYFMLDFAAPRGGALLAGRHYRGAARWPFQDSAPGLSVIVGSNSCNTLHGEFTVRRAIYDARGRILSFAASFVQRCEANPEGLRGTVSFRRIYLYGPRGLQP